MNGRFIRSVKDFWKKFQSLNDREFRHAYVRENIRIGIPHQIRAMRDEEERKWTQTELGKRAGNKPQNVISRLENPKYGKLRLKTLLELAEAFDVALLIKFVPFSRFIAEFDDVSPSALEAKGYKTEYKTLEDAERLRASIQNNLADQFILDVMKSAAESTPSKTGGLIGNGLGNARRFQKSLEVVGNV